MLKTMLLNNIIAIVLFIALNLFDDYNETTVPDCPEYCAVEHIHKENTIEDGHEEHRPRLIVQADESDARNDEVERFAGDGGGRD